MTAPHLLSERFHHSSSPSLHVVKPPANCLTGAMLENWIDGIVVLTQTGDCVRSNEIGRQICDRIAKEYPCNDPIPQEIWHVCQILLKSRRRLTNRLVIAESELQLQRSHEHIRIRVRWLDSGSQGDPHILVILENQTLSQQNLARTEAIRYGLSPREEDVWTLHRIGYSYQEIAEELHIALNTVKKHMKNTYAKHHLVSMVEGSYVDELAS